MIQNLINDGHSSSIEQMCLVTKYFCRRLFLDGLIGSQVFWIMEIASLANKQYLVFYSCAVFVSPLSLSL